MPGGIVGCPAANGTRRTHKTLRLASPPNPDGPPGGVLEHPTQPDNYLDAGTARPVGF